MKHLSESILSKKTGIYRNTIRPYKSGVLEWLNSHNFIECDRHDYIKNRYFLAKEKNDIYYCGPNIGRDTDWVAIHTKMVYEMVFWFGENEEIQDIELRHYPSGIDYLTFDDAVKTLLEA